MKTLLSELCIHITPEGSGVVNSGGRYFTVSEQTVLLLNVLKTAIDTDSSVEIARRLSKQIGFTVSAQEVEQAIDELPAAFFENTPVENEFSWSIPLLEGRKLDMLARFFSKFFSPIPAFFLIVAASYILWRTNEAYLSGSAVSLIVPLLVLPSILFHELGHAAACARAGAQPRHIGIGLKGIFPTFYTDVSDIWSRGRWARMQVDVGGIYFQFLYAAAMAFAVPWFPSVLPAISLTLLLAAFSCLPYFKFDGYWLLGDFLKLNDLGLSVRNKRDQLLAQCRAGTFSLLEIAPLIGIVSYYSGLVVLLAWSMYSLGSLLQRQLNTVGGDFSAGGVTFSSLPVLLLLAIIVAGMLRTLVGSVRELRFLAFDLPSILRAVALGLLTSLATPLLHLPRKHRAYIDAVVNGMNRAIPPIPNAKVEARRSVAAKYYEAFWYQLLNSVSVATGRWLVRATHRIRSSRTLTDVANTPGPVILAAPHYGSFISGAILLLSEVGPVRPIHLFYADPKTDPGNRGYEDFYRRYFPNLSVCFNNKRGIIEAVKALRRGEVLVIMPDVFYGTDLTAIKLLGQDVGTMAGIAYFHQKFNASVIPVLSRFSGLFAVNVHVGETLVFQVDESCKDLQQARIMEQLFEWLAHWFRRHPDNWHCWGQYGRGELRRSIPISDAVSYLGETSVGH